MPKKKKFPTVKQNQPPSTLPLFFLLQTSDWNSIISALFHLESTTSSGEHGGDLTGTRIKKNNK